MNESNMPEEVQIFLLKKKIKEVENQEKISRDGIKHEDELISKRMTWMTTIHGFLFSALGFSFGKSLSIIFYLIIATTGFLISFSTLLVLVHAINAIDIYTNKWKELKKSNLNLDTDPDPSGIIKGYSYKNCIWLQRCISPAMFVPFLFMCAWVSIGVFAFLGRIDPTIKKIDENLTPKPSKIELSIDNNSLKNILNFSNILNASRDSSSSKTVTSQQKSLLKAKPGL